MPYINKMCLRMIGVCLVPLFFSLLASFFVSAILGLPETLGHGQPLMPDLPAQVIGAGAVGAFVLFVIQFIRLLRWEDGHGDCCDQCYCLLGFERKGPWSMYRKCLGCGKNHSTQTC
jgi:hypothetical protein